MRALFSLLIPPLLLGACTAGVPVERTVVVSGARFEAVQGEAAFVVRTYLPAEGNERREVVGARCKVVSSLYATELVTPARLVVPNFGPQSPEITVECAADGRTGTGTATVFTRWQGPPGVVAPGMMVAGPGWIAPGPAGWGWWGAAPGVPISGYADLAVILHEP